MGATRLRALVSGATGYIGSHMVSALAAADWEVAGLFHKTAPADQGSCQWLAADKARDAVINFRPHVIFHLATLYKPQHAPSDVAAMIEANLHLGAELLDGLQSIGGGGFVNAGTYFSYDAQGGAAPNSFYAATKLSFQQMLDYYAREGGVRAATLVLFDVYGPGDRRGKLLPQLISLARNSTSSSPLGLTPGQQILDFLHIKDVLNAFLVAAIRTQAGQDAEGGWHRVWCLPSGLRLSLRDVVTMIETIVARSLPVTWGARPYPPHQVFRPTAGLPTLPGWQPQISLEAGIREMLNAGIDSAGSV